MPGPLSEEGLEMFAQALAYGFTPYRAAQESGLDFSAVEATHASTREDVVERVNELTRTQLFDASLEHLRIARQLEVDRDFAYETGNANAAINATVQRAKLLGHFVERTQTDERVVLSSPDQMTADEWKRKFGSPDEENTDA